MNIQELMRLKNSNEAPFNHDAFTIWIHNKILEEVNRELWEFREAKSSKIPSSYAACNHIMTLPSLQPIK